MWFCTTIVFIAGCREHQLPLSARVTAINQKLGGVGRLSVIEAPPNQQLVLIEFNDLPSAQVLNEASGLAQSLDCDVSLRQFTDPEKIVLLVAAFNCSSINIIDSDISPLVRRGVGPAYKNNNTGSQRGLKIVTSKLDANFLANLIESQGSTLRSILLNTCEIRFTEEGHVNAGAILLIKFFNCKSTGDGHILSGPLIDLEFEKCADDFGTRFVQSNQDTE